MMCGAALLAAPLFANQVNIPQPAAEPIPQNLPAPDAPDMPQAKPERIQVSLDDLRNNPEL